MAFVADSEAYRCLFNMFLDETLSIYATAKDVLHEFPTLMGKTGDQIQGGFHRCKTKAKAELATREGKFFPNWLIVFHFYDNDDVVVNVVVFITLYCTIYRTCNVYKRFLRNRS
jgi:hypothetical protein